MVIKNDTRQIPNKAFTHGGTFHSDDVFSAALLKILNPDIVIERGFTVPEGYDGIVFDIGMGEFDHHQLDNESRENGVPYASFGKLWQAFGNRLVGEDGIKNIDKNLVQVIDLSDNTGAPNPLSMIISSQNPSWTDEICDYDACFEQAVSMATTMLCNEIKKERDLELAKELATRALEGSAFEEIVIVDRFAPVVDFLSSTNAEFVIMPSNRGGYMIQSVNLPDSKTPKKPMPESWAGQANNLPGIANIEDLTFCHSGRWMCAADSLEGAVKSAIVAYGGQDRYTPEMDQILHKIISGDQCRHIIKSKEEIDCIKTDIDGREP